MLSSNEKSGTHDACVASIKQEPDDNIDWIIEENIHSDDDDEDDDSSPVKDKQKLFLKQEQNKESVTVLPTRPASELKWKCVSKQKTNLSKVVHFNSLIEDLKRKSLPKQCVAETVHDSVVQNIKIEHNVSEDVLKDKGGGIIIKEEPSEIYDRNIDCQNNDDLFQHCPKQDSQQFVGKNTVSCSSPETLPNISDNSNNTHSTLRNLLTHVPVMGIDCSISTVFQANDSVSKQTTFSNKAWLPKLTELIRSKPKGFDEGEDILCSQESNNIPAGMNAKYDQLLKNLVNRSTTERSGDDKNQESRPKLLTTQTLTSLLKPAAKEHVSEPHFDCEECDKSFGTFPSLVAHKKYHRMKQKLVCTTCQKEFTVRREYDRHVRKHKEHVEPTCPVCNKMFSVMGAMKRHMLIHGQQPAGEDRFYANDLYAEGQEKCPLCDETFSKYYIKHHMKIHSTNKPHVCILCGKTFTHKQSLEAHKLKHKREMMVWNCKVCDQKFDYEYLLKRHMKLHTKYKCDKCDKTLRNRASYVSHWRTHNSFSYCCHVCNRTYSRYSAYYSHYQTHKNVDSKPLPENTGDFTNELFIQTYQRIDDLNSVHNFNDETSSQDLTSKHISESDPLTKVTADNSFDSSDTSQSGGNVQESDSLPIPNPEVSQASNTLVCHLCKWDASSERSLKRHLLIHQPRSKDADDIKADLLKMCKEGVVQCPVCEENFSRYYIRHHLKIHSKDRPYSCEMSDDKSGLLPLFFRGRQKKTIWSCDLCGDIFNQQYLLKQHMETHESSHTTTSKKTEDLSADKSCVLTSTCLPEPSIEIDNGEEDTKSIQVSNVMFEITEAKAGSTTITKIKCDQGYDGNSEN